MGSFVTQHHPFVTPGAVFLAPGFPWLGPGRTLVTLGAAHRTAFGPKAPVATGACAAAGSLCQREARKMEERGYGWCPY